MVIGLNVRSGSRRKFLLSCIILLLLPAGGTTARTLSNAEISAEMKKEENRAIVDAFLKQELRDVNKYVTVPLINKHPSLVFFIEQVDKGPLDSLFFLEKWCHTLLDAQKHIDSFPYSITFSSSEKKKILELRPVTEKIISIGIPLMKRDFYRVAEASKELAKKKGRDPVELMADPQFRNAVYRRAEPDAGKFEGEMGTLSEGELVCFKLGWVLEQVTVTSLWLQATGNNLPKPDDYMAYRKKRTEYFDKRLKQIYGQVAESRAGATRSN